LWILDEFEILIVVLHVMHAAAVSREGAGKPPTASTDRAMETTDPSPVVIPHALA